MVAGVLVLGDILTAAALLVALLVGVFIVRPLLVGLAGQLPVIGPAVAGRVDSIINAWLGGLTVSADATMAVWTSLTSWLDSQWRQLSQTMVSFAQLTYAAFYRIEFVIAPRLADLALAQAETLIADEATHAETLAVGLSAMIGAEVARVEADAGRLFATAEANAVALVSAEAVYAARLVQHAEQTAVQLAAAERAAMVAGVNGVTAYASTLYSELLARMTAAEAVLGHDIGAVAEQERAALGHAIGNLTGNIDASKAAAIAAAAALALPLEVAIRDIQNSRCMRACDVLGAVGEGMQLLDLAAILGLVEAARTDPQAIQRFMVSEVAPAVQRLRATVSV